MFKQKNDKLILGTIFLAHPVNVLLVLRNWFRQSDMGRANDKVRLGLEMQLYRAEAASAREDCIYN